MHRKRIFYITRSIYPLQKGGGPLMRKAAVDKLRLLGFEVIVVVPRYNSIKSSLKGDFIQVATIFSFASKFLSILQRVGLIDDAMIWWSKKAFRKLKDLVVKDDLILVTSGGDLGGAILGLKLKDRSDCSLVLNFRDPIEGTKPLGHSKNEIPHVNRSKLQSKLFNYSDWIITSSETYLNHLTSTFNVREKITNNYFGYIDTAGIIKDKHIGSSGKYRIVYSGNMQSSVQGPEILIDAVKLCENKDKVELIYIGDITSNDRIKNCQEDFVTKLNRLERNVLSKYLTSCDIGFLSLAKDYYSACIPSKLYEYISHGLVILAAVPGDEISNIVHKKMGRVTQYNIEHLATEIDDLIDRPDVLDIYRDYVFRNRDVWSMDNQIRKIVPILIQ